jgi:hypothetical protein
MAAVSFTSLIHPTAICGAGSVKITQAIPNYLPINSLPTPYPFPMQRGYKGHTKGTERAAEQLSWLAFRSHHCWTLADN